MEHIRQESYQVNDEKKRAHESKQKARRKVEETLKSTFPSQKDTEKKDLEFYLICFYNKAYAYVIKTMFYFLFVIHTDYFNVQMGHAMYSLM